MIQILNQIIINIISSDKEFKCCKPSISSLINWQLALNRELVNEIATFMGTFTCIQKNPSALCLQMLFVHT